jgi:hypothetical protein
MGKITQPYDLLELGEYSRLKTILQDNYALEHNEYRPLQEFDKAMRVFARDFLRNYLKDSFSDRCSDEEIEKLILDFELELYGTQNNSDDKG